MCVCMYVCVCVWYVLQSDCTQKQKGNPHEFGTHDYWKWLVHHYSATCYHPTSTARMGTNEQAAVVDLELKVINQTTHLSAPAFSFD